MFHICFSENPFQVPLFRAVDNRYPVEDFAEGITTGHPTMTQFKLDPAKINDLRAYLDSVQG